MATDLGRSFSPTFTGHPPHMSPEDFELYLRHRAALVPDLEEIYFDVGLGNGRPIPPNTPANLARMWTRNNQQRADAIAIYPDHVEIIEYRFDASANALGRLLTYAELLAEDNPFGKPITLRIVTNNASPDVVRIAPKFNVAITTLP